MFDVFNIKMKIYLHFILCDDNFVVVICCGVKNLEVKDGMLREVDAFQTAANGFRTETVRRHLQGGCCA